MSNKNLDWFKDRIGKKVFRKRNFCQCNTCLEIWENGITILDEMHADYLYCIEMETNVNYFDKNENNEQQ